MSAKLNCLVTSTTNISIYPFEIYEDFSLSVLVEKLKDTYFLEIENYTLWKVNFPLDAKKKIQEIRIHNPYNLAVKELLDGVQLQDREMKIGIAFPAVLTKNHIHLVVQIEPISNDLVYVFVDDTNLFIQGKFVVGNLEQQGLYGYKKRSLELDEFRIEHRLLYNTVLRDRKKGNTPVIVGSRPPDDNTLWNFIQQQDYEVIVHDRNTRNREKSVDTELGHAIDEVVFSCSPGILVLVSGDRDYCPFVKKALDRGWNVEIWFWKKGTSAELKSMVSWDISNSARFIFLEDHYKKFSFACGIPSSIDTQFKTMYLTGDIITTWRTKDVLKCFIDLELFGWLEWKNDQMIKLYYRDEFMMTRARSWIEENWVKKYPSLCLVSLQE